MTDAVIAETPILQALVELLYAAYYTPDALAPRHEAWIAAWLRRYIDRVQRDPVEPAVRQTRMRQANPKFVLRNYLAQQAIEAADRGDLSLIETLLEVMRYPYDEQPAHEALAGKRPEWARHKPGCSALSCSS